VKKLIIAKGNIKMVACDIVPVINIISLRRLIDGGAAILAQTSKNHHNEIIGRDISSPLVKAILRVCVIS